MQDRTQPRTPGFEREEFIGQLARLLADWGAGAPERLVPLLSERLADANDGLLRNLAERVVNTGGEWGFHPSDPLGRRLSRLTMELVLEPDSVLHDAENLETARDRPVVLLGNHLSFVDGNVLDHLLEQGGYGDVAERLTVLVGPKVFTLPIRRMASLCFGTIKIPQSAARASGEALMSPREVARLARSTLVAVSEHQANGEHLLVFPEGSRSRSAAMQRTLPAVARYLEHPDALVLPFGLWGTEKLVPIEEDHVYPAVVQARVGKPLAAARLFELAGGKRKLLGDALGYLIADLLPAAYRGVYADTPEELSEARRVATGAQA